MHLIFQTGDLQIKIITSIANDIKLLIPNSDTQVMFTESNENKLTIAYDSWYTERKLSTDGNELQLDFASAQHIISPKKVIVSFQTADRVATPNKNNNIASFDNVNVKKFFVKQML